VRAELHRERDVRRGADARVDDHGDLDELEEDPDRVRVQDALPRSDGRARGHHALRAELREPDAEARVVRRVDEDVEALMDELLRRLERADGIGQERLRIAEDLELHELRREKLARELGGADRGLRVEAAGRVREDRVAGSVEVVEERRAGIRVEVHAADGDGDAARSAREERLFHELEGGVLARPDEQPRFEREVAEDEGCRPDPALPASHDRDDLDLVRGPEDRRLAPVARHDVLVDLDGDHPGPEAELLDEAGDGRAFLRLMAPPVQLDDHRRRRF
jgi:hypothetical protein